MNWNWTVMAVGLAAGMSYSSAGVFRAVVVIALARLAGLI